jgi:hypothetical protein
VLASVYVLSGSGRIDIIDGQARYEVAKNWLDSGEPVILDPYAAIPELRLESGGKLYAVYNAAPSVAAMPLMLAERALPGHSAERERFAFSLTCALFGAAGGVLLFAAFRMLGLGMRAAAFWSAAFCLTTLWWPGATTVFDQCQHAVWLFAALLLAWQSGRRRSYALAAAAGLAGGVLFDYQENYGLLLPFVAVAVFATAEEGAGAGERLRVTRDGVLRYALFGAASAVGLAGFFAFNFVRFGTFFPSARYAAAELFNGNPVPGLLSLTLSLGRSVFLFSPPLVLAFFGARRLWRRAPALVTAIGLVTVLQVAFITNLSFFGGDWCWGPRYMLVLHPLWALSFPFAVERLGRRRVGALLAAGLVVQLMAASVDHQRFFFEHNLLGHFWRDQWAYFKVTQLGSRPFEIADMIANGVPAEATQFNSSPTGEATYCPYGMPGDPLGMRRYEMFFLPRPWPLWTAWLGPARRPFDLGWLVAACLLWLAAGAAAMWAALRSSAGRGP